MQHASVPQPPVPLHMHASCFFLLLLPSAPSFCSCLSTTGTFNCIRGHRCHLEGFCTCTPHIGASPTHAHKGKNECEAIPNTCSQGQDRKQDAPSQCVSLWEKAACQLPPPAHGGSKPLTNRRQPPLKRHQPPLNSFYQVLAAPAATDCAVHPA